MIFIRYIVFKLIADNKIYLFLVIFVISSCQKYTFIMRPILLTLDFGIRLRFVLSQKNVYRFDPYSNLRGKVVWFIRKYFFCFIHLTNEFIEISIKGGNLHYNNIILRKRNMDYSLMAGECRMIFFTSCEESQTNRGYNFRCLLIRECVN